MSPSRNLPEILARIENRLDVVGLSEFAAAKAAGKPDAIRNMRRAVDSGKRHGVSTVTLAALAPVLKTTEAWLMTGRDEPRVVQVMGFAAAGSDDVVFADAQGPFDEVDAPAWATERTVAVRIRGNSLGKPFNGWLAFYDDRRDPPDESLHGQLCICGLATGGVVIKTLRPSQAKGRFHLESLTEPTLYDQAVEWAALVREMRPR